MPIGPALPPHLAHLAAASSRSPSASPPPGPLAPTGPALPVDEEEGDDYVPALPPHLLAARQARASSSGVEKKSVNLSIGPSVSPSIGATLPTAGPARSSSISGPSFPEDDDSDDEVIGPVPVPTAGEEEEDEAQAAVREFLEREERRRKQAEEKDKPKAPQREEWMLVLPTSGVLSNGKSISSETLSDD